MNWSHILFSTIKLKLKICRAALIQQRVQVIKQPHKVVNLFADLSHQFEKQQQQHKRCSGCVQQQLRIQNLCNNSLSDCQKIYLCSKHACLDMIHIHCNDNQPYQESADARTLCQATNPVKSNEAKQVPQIAQIKAKGAKSCIVMDMMYSRRRQYGSLNINRPSVAVARTNSGLAGQFGNFSLFICHIKCSKTNRKY